MKRVKSRIAVAVLTALAMVFTLVPGMAFAGEQVANVKITFSAATSEGFDVMPMTLTVADNLTETYYPHVTVEPKGQVTVSDAIVAAHIAKYGDKFKDNPSAYYEVADGSYGTGYVTKQFGHFYVSLTYVNKVSASSGVCASVLKNGDLLETGVYTDGNYSDLYSSFDESAYRITAGETVSVKIKADNWGTPVTPNSGVKIMTIKTSGKMGSQLAVTDANGEGSVTFAKAGVYNISATGTASYDNWSGAKVTGNIIAPYAQVTVYPAVPASVKAKAVGVTSIKVSWKKASGVSGYEVYRASSENGRYEKVKTTTASVFVNNNLKTGKTYYYKIKAYKTVDGKKYYSAFSKKVNAKAVPAVPVVKLTAGKSSMKVSWKKVSGADGYQIYRSKTKNGKYAKIKTASKKSTSYKSINLTAKKTYYVKVRAYKKVNGKNVYGNFSAVKAIKTK